MVELSALLDLGRYPRFIVNSLFVVPQASSGNQQLIVDCRAGNAHMPLPESPRSRIAQYLESSSSTPTNGLSVQQTLPRTFTSFVSRIRW